MTRSVFLVLLTVCVKVGAWANDGEAVFIPEFTLIRRDHLPEDFLHDGHGVQKPEDPSSRTARSEEDRDTLWDAWGSWSECSRTCGGGASYSLRRCLSSKTCEGQNIKYRTCSNVDCPPDAGDFRAQQCSAHVDERYQGQYHEWLPVDNDPDNPCALKCKAKGLGLVVELAPKVLDGTRCYTESLDMCISGVCQIVGCDHELGSAAKEDSCGVCNGDGSSCRLVRGHHKTQHASGKVEDTVVVIPYGSRHVRLVLKGPDHLSIESKTLQGVKEDLSLEASGQYHLENSTLDFQNLSDKEVLRIAGPLGADFTVKVQYASGADSVIQFIYYQPIIHRWRETDFFPCSATCGGGYQLTSAECFDLRSGRVVVDQYCHYYPENVKPKPKLQECNMDPCLASDGYKQIMPYDLYHPLPRWESAPWTACSTSCGGGVQSRSVSCVEEDMQGTITQAEEWKCLYSTKTAILQPCNTFNCPTWLAQEWSPCTVTCGQGLRYRVVLCIDHRGLHAGGCNPTTKPHIKEECLVTVPCYKPAEKLPVEAKPIWHKQAIELEEQINVTEEPTFVPGPWAPCSRTCGAGTQRRSVRCQVLLSFSQTVADLPDDECEGAKPAAGRRCYRTPCRGGAGPGAEEDAEEGEEEEEEEEEGEKREDLHDWEYEGFTECSESCGGGVQEAVVICLNKQTRDAADQSRCVSARRPPQLLQDCNTRPCPPRWETGAWSLCSATCGVGLMTRKVSCTHRPSRDSNRTASLRDEQCPASKPSPVQACNRFDCPPMWDARDWEKCSRSCGGGVQRREVLCKQRLADGSALEMPETFCPSTIPPKQQACAKQECPPRLVTSDWSKCSVTCGEGLQRLQTVCAKQGEDGQIRIISSEACAPVSQLSSIRACSLRPCNKTSKLEVVKPDPTILAQRKVYIQWRKGKKLQFVVGGYAYLFPWTSVVLRCPTRRFRKGHIQWLKEGKPLVSLPHLSITSLGYVKMQQLRASDAGVYTCVAGQAQESFVLNIIGRKQKLSWPEVGESWLYTEGPRKASLPGTGLTKELSQELRASFNRYDNIVQRLLDLKDSVQEDKDIVDIPHSNEKNRSTLEDEEATSELSNPLLLIAETKRLDEIAQYLSEGLGGPQVEKLIAQLLGELTVAQGDTNESTLHPPEKAEFSTQGPLLYKPNIKTHTTRARGPVIIQRPKVSLAASSEAVFHVGVPILLRRQVDSLLLRCEALGQPEPTLTWTRNGQELRPSGRVGLLPDGSLKIMSPGTGDEGVYTCTARNHHGSTSMASRLQVPGHKGQSCFQTDGSLCPDSSNSSQSCHGQACPLRWQGAPWSPCSASCGGGIQSRRVGCVRGPGDRATELDIQHCAGLGRRPSTTRPCSVLPCAGWTAAAWGLCHGHCIGPSLATQHRSVFCRDLNGTTVPHRSCGGLQRPGSLKNCTTEACSVQWRLGPWTQCTATCGRHGFQSRPVTCGHRRTGRVVPEHHCSWRPRPPSWQRCNVLSCGRGGECRDSTRYCEKVRQLELCPLPQFKSRCCQSCRDT